MADNRNWTETLSSPGPIKKSEAIYMVSGRLPSSSIRTVTVGSGISPDQPPKRVADFNCRWGLSPRPEDQFSLVTTGVRGLPRKIVTGCVTPWLAIRLLIVLRWAWMLIGCFILYCLFLATFFPATRLDGVRRESRRELRAGERRDYIYFAQQKLEFLLT